MLFFLSGRVVTYGSPGGSIAPPVFVTRAATGREVVTWVRSASGTWILIRRHKACG